MEGTDRPSLLTIPPELRNDILQQVLIDTKVILIQSAPTREEPLEPPLLFVCKQLRNEGLPIFYGANTFQAYACTTFQFLARLPRDTMRLVRRVRSNFYVGMNEHELRWTCRDDWMRVCSRINLFMRILEDGLKSLDGHHLRKDDVLGLIYLGRQEAWVPIGKLERRVADYDPESFRELLCEYEKDSASKALWNIWP
ncbi:hypothetical protein LTR62_000998 [Meristemomyces frigidus]|uniref:F-box domain-containing protein n=1 Tax=Meristemomyces frigidus TaxID=1508187 RepID=A0AAN7T8V6_9PEZI|nr:hypothetical protein LTR62_000998 [Meristemomyces frigidus]